MNFDPMRYIEHKYSDKYMYSSATSSVGICNVYAKYAICEYCGNVIQKSELKHSDLGCPGCGAPISKANAERLYG